MRGIPDSGQNQHEAHTVHGGVDTKLEVSGGESTIPDDVDCAVARCVEERVWPECEKNRMPRPTPDFESFRDAPEKKS